MFEFIFLRLFFMSIGMSAAGLVVFGATRLFSGIFTKRMCYYLWLIPLVLSIVPVAGTAYRAASESVGSKSVVYEAPYTPQQAVQEETGMAAVQTQNRQPVQTAAEDVPVQTSERQMDVSYTKLLTLFYFGGALLLTVVTAAKSLRFRLWFRKTAVCCPLAMLEQCKVRAGLKRAVRAYTVPYGCAPFVYGILRPKIVIHGGEITYEALLHELTHIKRRDLLYLQFVNAVKILHFFNPLVYWFAREIKRNMEMSCDERASAVMSAEERLAYSKSILHYSTALSPGIACLSENGKNLKERIDVIMTTKGHSRAVKLISAVLALVLIAGQVAFAAAVNGNAPVQSYILNNAVAVYSVIYRNGGVSYSSGTSGLEANRALLVNTEVYKGFSADLKVVLMSGRSWGQSAEETMDADIHVEMERFIKSVDDGRVWQGLFQVVLNNEVILSGAKGYLNDVPGPGSRRPARLYIEDGETVFEIECIQFSRAPDGKINAEYEEEQQNDFDAAEKRYLAGSATVKRTHDGVTDTEECGDVFLRIYTNPEAGGLLCDEIPFVSGRYITTVPGAAYTFSGDSVAGRFFLKMRGGIIADEFEGTLSGLSSNSVQLKSADGSILVDMQVESDAGAAQYYEDAYRYSRSDGSAFEDTCTEALYRRRLSDLPFTLTLNKDRTKVILQVKDGFAPAAWYYSYSSYAGTEEDVYNAYHSKYGARTTELDLCTVTGCSHNLQFSYYNADPYVSKSCIDIMFRIINGELYYTNCAEYVTENKNYSGAEGLEMIKEHLAQFAFTYFKD